MSPRGPVPGPARRSSGSPSDLPAPATGQQSSNKAGTMGWFGRWQGARPRPRGLSASPRRNCMRRFGQGAWVVVVIGRASPPSLKSRAPIENPTPRGGQAVSGRLNQ